MVSEALSLDAPAPLRIHNRLTASGWMLIPSQERMLYRRRKQCVALVETEEGFELEDVIGNLEAAPRGEGQG